MELDLSKMLAGSRYRGDFEKRIKGVIEEIVSLKKRGCFLFIENYKFGSFYLQREVWISIGIAFRGELQVLQLIKKKIEPDSALT